MYLKLERILKILKKLIKYKKDYVEQDKILPKIV